MPKLLCLLPLLPVSPETTKPIGVSYCSPHTSKSLWNTAKIWPSILFSSSFGNIMIYVKTSKLLPRTSRCNTVPNPLLHCTTVASAIQELLYGTWRKPLNNPAEINHVFYDLLRPESLLYFSEDDPYCRGFKHRYRWNAYSCALPHHIRSHA